MFDEFGLMGNAIGVGAEAITTDRFLVLIERSTWTGGVFLPGILPVSGSCTNRFFKARAPDSWTVPEATPSRTRPSGRRADGITPP